MVLSKNMQKLVAGSSTIRKLFEEGIELAKEVGAENVYDFSLGNPAAPVPEEVKKSIYDILENRNANFVHCYMPNAGYPEVREKVAANLNVFCVLCWSRKMRSFALRRFLVSTTVML